MMKSAVSVALATIAALVLAGCAKHLQHLVQPNQAPTLEMKRLAPVKNADSYRFEARWAGIDPEGRLDHYVYALNPPSVDRVDATWVSTRQTEWSRTVAHLQLESVDRADREPVILAVRAVDDRGAMSEPGFAGFFEGNLPPDVRIISPSPSALVTPTLPQSVTISWQGTDPDGQFTQRPVKYKYLLIGQSSEFSIDLAAQNPDSLRRYYAPLFVGWDSTSAETTFARFSRLSPSLTYMFVVIAFDEAGDYSPVFSLNTNMLRFRVGYSKSLGPRLTLLAPGIEYTPPPGYRDDPAQYAKAVVPANQPISFWWFAVPSEGAQLTGYRWVLDPVDIFDETPRSSPGDYAHWSEPSLISQITLGPFTAGPKGTTHLLFVEARDSNGLRSLGVIGFLVVNVPLDKELLIVDDTRLAPDRFNQLGALSPPQGRWPTAAELDTFLYARGGFPWRGYPEGTMSTPGLFEGYSYDTLGTRTGRSDLTVPLSLLIRYRHVIWYVDLPSANNFAPGSDVYSPMTALRYMSSPGRLNTLASYVGLGGKVWLAGGGAAFATLRPWDDPANNFAGATVFSVLAPRRELGPGRLMYDYAAWRSGIRVSMAQASISRFTGRLPAPAGLPTAMQAKTPATDPFPPLRSNSGDFYQTTFDVELLQLPNEIIEDVNPDPDLVEEQSTLDTLYRAAGGGLPIPSQNPHNVVMTYYHGPASAPFVFTGFNFWSYNRSQCQGLVDYVLQGIWGLSRTAASRPTALRQPVRANQRKADQLR